ncbi:unnamed protein product [Lota lota]
MGPGAFKTKAVTVPGSSSPAPGTPGWFTLNPEEPDGNQMLWILADGPRCEPHQDTVPPALLSSSDF